MPDFTGGPAFDIGRRIEIRGPFSWFALLGPATDGTAAVEDLATELGAVLEAQVRIVPYTGSAEILGSYLREPATDPVLISNLDIADAVQWSALDINRSGFAREGPVILCLSVDSLTQLCTHAPNIRSFLGGGIFHAGTSGGAMTSAERQERISSLESHFHISSVEVIKRAETGILPTEPHFVEWLVLLDRGDLVSA
jgi:hypothetical protein